MSAPLKINGKEYHGPIAWVVAAIIAVIVFMFTLAIITIVLGIILFILASPIIAIVLICILLF